MMKIYGIFVLSVILCNLGIAQEKSDGSRVVEGVVIKETYKAKFEEEKFPIKLNIDFSDVIQISEPIHWASVNLVKSETKHEEWKLFYFSLSTPEYTNIQPQPAKVFYIQFKDLSSWKLEIFSSDGSLFKSISGEGNPPESIAWDGFGDKSCPLTPGLNYAYAFNAVDKAGNRRTFPGQTFNIPALSMKYDNKVLVGIAFSEIFSSDGFNLLISANEYATELSSLIRYYSNKGNVSTDFDHPLKDKFLTLVSNNLNKDLHFFKERNDPKNKQNAVLVWIE